jgi:hypothetical protein
VPQRNLIGAEGAEGEEGAEGAEEVQKVQKRYRRSAGFCYQMLNNQLIHFRLARF